jgi:hypothetical protein
MPRPNRLPRRDIDAEIAAARELLHGIYAAILQATPRRKPRRRRILVDGEWILEEPWEPIQLIQLRNRQREMSETLAELVATKKRMEKANG